VNWNATLPIPKTDAERYPEVKALGARFHDRATLRTEKMLEGFRMEIAPERPDEFAPGSTRRCVSWSNKPPRWSLQRRTTPDGDASADRALGVPERRVLKPDVRPGGIARPGQ
jgi:hypothetical protein